MAHPENRWFKAVFWIFGLLVVYGLTRLVNLAGLPIFTDEAIYIRWSQIGSRDANWRFISLVDGKQPLFTWVMMVLLRFISEPLIAGRLVSVLAGAASLIGIWFLAHELFQNRKISFFSSILYLVIPFSLFYDRMALYDSLVGTFYIWNLYLAILLVRRQQLDIALILGLTLGAGMLNKSSGFLSLYLLPSTLLLFDFKGRQRFRRLVKWLGLIFLAALLSQAVYSVLRLSPFFHMVAQKDSVFVYPLSEWLTHPFNFFEGNLRGLFDWLTNYLTKPIFVVAMLPLFFLRGKTSAKILLYIWWLAPFIALALFGKVLYPRFILFMSMPLLVLAAVSIAWVSRRLGMSVLGLAAYLVLFWPSLYTDYFIITNPLYAPIPFADRGQYIDNWPAGWGVKEVNAFLQEQTKNGKIAVYTEGTFGLLPYALEIYQVDNPNIKIQGIWPIPQDLPLQMQTDALVMPTYFVLNQTQEAPLDWPLTLLSEYQKGTQKERKLRLYQLIPTSGKEL